MLNMLVWVHFSLKIGVKWVIPDNVQSTLIKKLIGQGKTYKEVQKSIGCSAEMISNAIKQQQIQEDMEVNLKLPLEWIEE